VTNQMRDVLDRDPALAGSEAKPCRSSRVSIPPLGGQRARPPSVSDFDRRPAVALGTSQSSATFRFTRTPACARMGLTQDRQQAVHRL
jgi:hypothetical protein